MIEALGAVIAGCLNTIQEGASRSFVGLGMPDASRASQTPWWAWVGGALGAIYILMMIFFAEK